MKKLITVTILVVSLLVGCNRHTDNIDCHGPHDCGYADNGHNGDN